MTPDVILLWILSDSPNIEWGKACAERFWWNAVIALCFLEKEITELKVKHNKMCLYECVY